MAHRFDYLIDKILQADFLEEPFKHLDIQDFLEPSDFESITCCAEIQIEKSSSDLELFDRLFALGYKMVPFPGAITNHLKYALGRQVEEELPNKTTCESAGVVLRLVKPVSETLVELKQFIEGKAFNAALAEKFELDLEYCSIDSGIQKYLDGYEISPHPDLRKKALTYMLNVNSSPDSHLATHHTHFMKFKNERRYIQELWKFNVSTERCWVPWDWASTEKQQTKNNSITIFAPSFDTLHAVKAEYCHLEHQRTQIYGNLWHKADSPHFLSPQRTLEWWELDFSPKPQDDNRKVIWDAVNLNVDEQLVERNRKANY